MSNDKIKPTPPIMTEWPPVRRVVNEKVINKKEIEDWDNRKKK